LAEWPEAGPRLLWRVDGLGYGYSAPIITGGRIYLAGDVGDELRIFALDTNGKRLWESGNGRSWKDPYPGARASCTYSEGRLYHMNAHGRIACLDAETGKELWAVNVLDRFEGKNITWAISENVLVNENVVMVTPGGRKAFMAALDKKTGKTVWASEPLKLGPSENPRMQRLVRPVGETDPASYGSPVLIRWQGKRLLITSSQRHFAGVDRDSGQLVWTRPFPTRYEVIPGTPLLVGDAVFMTAPDTDAGGLYRLKLTETGWDVDRVWRTELDTCHGGWVLVDGLILGSWYRSERGWAAIDAGTGQVLWKWKDIPKGSVIWADDRCYCLGEDGTMVLLEAKRSGPVVKGRFRLVEQRVNDAWTHPVILDGRLYLRYHESLYCYDIRRQSGGARSVQQN
ncbi:MAG: PQQ-binding-like beta-propeller repeat protein, partial [Verrucomicrobiae bacterium]|nr:PQQ-binding-like beta-propeller repeat protein [Verrucomicrobiae bacterium]